MSGELLSFVFRSLNTTVVNLLLFLLYRKIYEPKYNKRSVYVIAFILTTLLYISVTYVVDYLGISILNTVYSLIHYNLVCIILFKSNLKKSFLYNSLFFIVSMLADVLTYAFWAITEGDSLGIFLSNAQHIAVSCLMNVIIMILVWQIFVSLLSKNESVTIKLRQAALLGAFDLFASFVIYNFVTRIYSSRDGVVLICILIGFLLLSLLIMYYTKESTRIHKNENEVELAKAQNRSQLEYYIKLKEKY